MPISILDTARFYFLATSLSVPSWSRDTPGQYPRSESDTSIPRTLTSDTIDMHPDSLTPGEHGILAFDRFQSFHNHLSLISFHALGSRVA